MELEGWRLWKLLLQTADETLCISAALVIDAMAVQPGSSVGAGRVPVESAGCRGHAPEVDDT